MKLTVRMALSHRAGLPNWRDAKGLAFDHDPGATTDYSGEGYQYAVRYAEHRTGQLFETLAGRWLFAPARMRASGYVSAQGETVPIAVPYDDAVKPLPVERVTRYNAADLAHATARDYLIKDYGAIKEGEHRFCELATGRCEGIAKFMMVWAKQDGAWRITSVLSYGHRAATPAEQRGAAGR